jgi:SEC-C motif-containing protein
MNTSANPKSSPCPCGSGQPYRDCCGHYLDHGESAATAEQLMRSRYTAYTQHREDYLLATWHPDTRPATLELTGQPAQQWLGLTVKRHEQTASDQAIVEFVARYKINGRAHRLHEISRFVRKDGEWLYVDGDILRKLSISR